MVGVILPWFAMIWTTEKDNRAARRATTGSIIVGAIVVGSILVEDLVGFGFMVNLDDMGCKIVPRNILDDSTNGKISKVIRWDDSRRQ